MWSLHAIHSSWQLLSDISCSNTYCAPSIIYCYIVMHCQKIKTILKGNTDTSGLLSGLVTIRLGDCGAKFKNVGNLRANPDVKSVFISWSKSVSVCKSSWRVPIYHSKSWFEFRKHILKQICISILIPDENKISMTW